MYKTIQSEFFGKDYDTVKEDWKTYAYPFYVPEGTIHITNTLESPLTMCIRANKINEFDTLMEHILDQEFS